MKNRLNCPNCGAPITAEKCAYCGSVFLDFAAIQVGTPSYVKFKLGDAYVITKLVVTNLDIECQCDSSTFSDAIGCSLAMVRTGQGCAFHLDAYAVMTPDSGSMVTIVQEGGAEP